MSKVFIMCAGSNSRWRNYRRPDQPYMKHLIIVYGKRIIDRSVSMLYEAGLRPTIVVSDKSTANRTKDYASFVVGRTRSLVHSIEVVIANHSLPALFLLGDVIYDPNDFETIINSFGRKDITFYGKKAETYAVWITPNRLNQVKSASRFTQGKLRDLRYQVRLGGVPIHRVTAKEEEKDRINDPNFIFTKGWTSNIDHNRALDHFLGIDLARGVLEAKAT